MCDQAKPSICVSIYINRQNTPYTERQSVGTLRQFMGGINLHNFIMTNRIEAYIWREYLVTTILDDKLPRIRATVQDTRVLHVLHLILIYILDDHLETIEKLD